MREIRGNEHSERVLEYLTAVDLPGDMATRDETAWCSAFAAWCFGSKDLTKGVNGLARSWVNWGSQCQPTFGCIVVLRRGTKPWQGHVGFFLARRGDDVIVWGGNQGNTVCAKAYPLKDVLAYRTLIPTF